MSINFARLRSEGEAIQPKLKDYRRAFHRTPELRMNTPKTERLILDALRSIGLAEITAGVGSTGTPGSPDREEGHGVVALIRGALPGKCLAIRSDMDGLPIQEETGLPFASENGAMHACGHDFHMAALLGAAELLWNHRDKLHGTVKLIFQPYEEGDVGAKRMIADHVLENPKVDAILGMHNGCHLGSDYRSGDILVTTEPTTSNIYAFKATFRGEGGHVCLSRSRTNPVYAAAEAVVRIRNVGRQYPEAIAAVTVINAGVRNNIIPLQCVIEGSLRSFDFDMQAEIREKVLRAIHESAEANGVSVSIETTVDVMRTRIDPELFGAFTAIAEQVYPERLPRLLHPDMIGEDFARYAELVPGFHFFLCARPEGARYPLHSPKFDLDEFVLSKAAVLFSAFALAWQE